MRRPPKKSLPGILFLAGLAAAAALAPALPLAAEEPSEGAGFKADLLDDFGRASDKLVSLAEAIPAEKYGWAPGEGVRTVAQVFMHVASTNYGLPTGLGTPLPEGTPEDFRAFAEKLEGVRDKAEVLKTLRESVEHAKKAIGAVADGDVGGTIQFFGRDMSRRRLMLILLTHTHEHLGQAIAYARSNEVVPPWSRARE